MTPVNDSELHIDLYSVAPAAMSDEQIALRDAMTVTAVSQAESVAAIAASLHSLLDGLCKSVERLETERSDLLAVLKRTTKWIEGFAYGAPCPEDGVKLVNDSNALIKRAEKLLAGG